jgi:16S rRNA (cytosine967-C5)-methyltransferase
MKFGQLRNASELLDQIRSGTAPADRVMDRYFRAHRNMGARDRGEVAELVYGCLRARRLLEHVVGVERAASQDLVAAQLLIGRGLSARALEEMRYPGDARALAERARGVDPAALPLAVRASLPDWLAERWVAELGASETEALAAALNVPASVDLRVNALKATREDVAAALAAEGHAAEPTPLSPFGLRLRKRAPLFQTAAFRKGLFEVQDEGSQLVSLLVEAQPRERIVDLCAGGGGKTLHLGALMQNSGTLYAMDTHARRLQETRRRLARAGLHSVRLVAIESENDAHVKRLRGSIDRVLVDAPCSGTGTLRRNPDAKWRELDLAELAARQRRILAAGAELLKPGGRLVYATCSLLREENAGVVDGFLAEARGFARVAVRPILERWSIDLPELESDLRLYPHRHGTDGFFAAVLERAAS